MMQEKTTCHPSEQETRSVIPNHDSRGKENLKHSYHKGAGLLQ